jgi:hypothetical protein
MLSLRPLQRALAGLYHLDVTHAVDDFVRPLSHDDPDAARREVVLVREPDDERPQPEIAVLLAPDVARALRGETVPGLPRFEAWCLALEAVSHFVLLAFRAANDRPVSQLELELQAEVDKFAVALVQRARHRAVGEAHLLSRRLRVALFDRQDFLDPAHTREGGRYRLAHWLASRYAASLERRYVREGRITRLIDELREFYRAGLSTKWAMALAA